MGNEPPVDAWDEQARMLIGMAEDLASRSREHYREVAVLISAAIHQLGINQKAAAAAVGKSTTWVSRLLGWQKAGCPERSIFDGQRSRPKKPDSHHWSSVSGYVMHPGRDEHPMQYELFPSIEQSRT